jgi:Hg(II)-responsive transcriptional regulator
MRVGELADAADVGVQTVRYYERRGLLPPPPRTPAGYRRYPPAAVDRVRFIRRAKELGFSLREIGELLELRTRERDQCADVRQQIDDKLADLEHRIEDLSRVTSALRLLREECNREDPAGDCPMLEALERDDLVCWCFRITGDRLRRDGETCIAFVAEKIRQGECDCATLNPSGRCCLGAMRAFVRDVG